MALDVDPAPVRGVRFRHVPAGGAPLHRPERPADGRWQRGEVVEGFYLADSVETAWADWYRALAGAALPPLRQLPRDLWRFEVDVDHVADLSSPERLERVKLEPSVSDRRQWPAYQTVGEALFAEGGRPSSTRLLPARDRLRSASSARATGYSPSSRSRRRTAMTSHRLHRVASAPERLARSEQSAVAGVRPRPRARGCTHSPHPRHT